jgi:acetylornithine/succinyldiaminopimelate/putrescine aminotransferase
VQFVCLYWFLQVSVSKESTEGLVTVTFVSAEHAAAYVLQMHGSTFGGRQVVAYVTGEVAMVLLSNVDGHDACRHLFVETCMT